MSKKIALITCSDPGGAISLAYYLKNKNINFISVIEKNAKKIFKNIFGNKLITTNLKQGLKKADYVITATSWNSEIEKKTIFMAKKKRIPTYTIIDHWINYEQRFFYKNKIILPNYLIVQDLYAEKLAKSVFKNTKILRVPNYYFKEFMLDYKKLKFRVIRNNLLYLSEPIKANYKKKNLNEFKDYNEFDSLRYFLGNVQKIVKKINKISIRLHPQEKINKFNNLIKEFDNLPIKICKNENLTRDIYQNQYIFGSETNAMVLGLLAKKKVICTIPANSKNKCSLPFKKISYMRNLI